MTRRAQMFVLFMSLQLFDNVNLKPIFKGISLKRAFDFSFIPMERHPISYIKERWSPFGVFGVRRSIMKRDLSNKDTDGVASATVLPPGHVAMPYLQMSHPAPAPVVENQDSPPIYKFGKLLKGLAPMMRSYSSMPPIILITTPNPKDIKPPSTGLNTDISRVPIIKDYLNSVEPPAEPVPAPTVVVEKEVPPAPENTLPVDVAALEENSILGGSKLALHLSNVLLKIVSEFFANARFSLSHLISSRTT